MDERRWDAISMVEARDCRGGVAMSMCILGAVAAETELLVTLLILVKHFAYYLYWVWGFNSLA